MTDEEPPGFEDGADVIAFRHPETNQPIAVPKELALTSSRTYRAYTDHLQGKTWEQIAEAHGYPDVRAAMYDVQVYVDAARALYAGFSLHQRRTVTHARLEALIAAAFPAAAGGNLPAISTIHSLLVTQIKLWKLDTVDEDEADPTQRTVIVGGDTEEEYVQQLEQGS